MELSELTLRELGQKMQDARKGKLSQQEIASKIGVSSKTISKWETGQKQPGGLSLIKYCSAIGITLDEMLGVKKNAFCGM